jgi:hypothetical protein
MAIDPIQFQGFTERQGFDPIKVPDPNPFLRENLSTIDRSLANLERGNLANMQAKADAYSQNLAKLSEFSLTLQDFMGQAAQIYDKKQEAAANALYYEDVEKHELDIVQLDEGERLLQEGNNMTSKAAVAANRNGAPYSVTKRIAELGGLKGYYYRVKATEDLAAKYDDYIDEARRTDGREISYGPNNQYKVKINETDPTETEESVIRATLREEYLEQFSGISRGMLAKYAFPIMRQVDESRATANSNRIALRDSEKTRYEALEQFQRGDMDLQTLVDTVSRTVYQTKDGKVVSLQYGGAWPKIQTILLELAKTGQYVDLEGLVGDSVNPDTNKKYKDDPMFATKIKAIQVEIGKAQVENYKNSETNGQVQVQQTLDSMLATLSETPTESEYQHVIDQTNRVGKAYGVVPDFTKLNHHRANFGRSALEIKHAMLTYEGYYKSGQLGNYVDQLQIEPSEIREKYLPLAQAQQKLQAHERGYKGAHEKIKSMINNALKSVPNETGVGDPLMVDYVIRQHISRTNTLMQTEEYNTRPEEASMVALQEIEKEVLAGRNDENSIYYVNQDGYSNFFEKRLGPNPALAANKRLQTINRLALNEGKSLLENEKSLSAILDKDTLVRAAEGWGRPGYQMDPAIDHLAKKLQLNYLNVIHRARETFGMTELPTLTQLAAKAENASPDIKKAITAIANRSISQNLYLRTSGTRDLPVRSAFQAVQPGQVLEPISSANHPYFVAIGVNEGTRTANGGYTKNWEGHIDPGDKNFNRGTVSGGRNNNLTAEQVDTRWMKILAQEQTKYHHAVERFAPRGTDLYKTIMFNILDLRVQAPLTIPDFVKRIPVIIAEGATPEVIGRLRAESYINPRTGRLEASGFNNDMNRLRADQTRRAGNFRIGGGS